MRYAETPRSDEPDPVDAEIHHVQPGVSHVYIDDVEFYASTGIRGATDEDPEHPGELRYVVGDPRDDGGDHTISETEALARVEQTYVPDSAVDFRLERITRVGGGWRLEYAYDGPTVSPNRALAVVVGLAAFIAVIVFAL